MTTFAAVVLAAGEGSRLRPLTRNRPKPMLPAATKPILARVFDRVIDAGCTDITVVVGYQRERVQSYFGPSYRNVPLTYVRQRTQLGTGHALLCARDAVSSPILVINGDQLVDQQIIEDVQSAHTATDAVATLGVLHRHDVSEYGGVLLADETETDGPVESTAPVAEVVERPHDDREYRLNAGVYALESAVFDAIAETKPQAGEHSLIDAISRLIDSESGGPVPVRAVESEGMWVDATYPWDLLQVNSELLEQGVSRTQPPSSNELLAGDGEVDSGGSVVVSQTAHDRSDISVHDTAIVREPVVIAPCCEIGPGAVVGPYACLGENVTVESEAVVTHSVLDTDSRVRASATVVECVAGQAVEIGVGSTVTGGPGDVRVGDRVFEAAQLGALLADNTRDEGSVTYAPGTIVGPDVRVQAGVTVRGTVAAGTEVRS
ncbi:NTP transferase domain-containing protein [Natronolimnobius sp. AArcel1]|uniref:sugar phosphate nucleotidyltransferase n=1 Tax=Natronolimnobius sp. AArcel1 TaxID=1679093 RepID=UPI0013EC1FD7|nr:sugar phosphate nucleotidyltransferase [Natronolimnobius sp. AArcel1]NGM70345.1 NTP transferase domain-containing protein [Natronolimnobius sp. AArcel1]